MKHVPIMVFGDFYQIWTIFQEEDAFSVFCAFLKKRGLFLENGPKMEQKFFFGQNS